MAKFRLSRRAEADLLSIGEFTLGEWGETQTIRYLGELEKCCQMLADNPFLGRACEHVVSACVATSMVDMSSSIDSRKRAS